MQRKNRGEVSIRRHASHPRNTLIPLHCCLFIECPSCSGRSFSIAPPSCPSRAARIAAQAAEIKSILPRSPCGKCPRVSDFSYPEYPSAIYKVSYDSSRDLLIVLFRAENLNCLCPGRSNNAILLRFPFASKERLFALPLASSILFF